MEREKIAEKAKQGDTRPRYTRPKITVMDREEVLKAFQMTAAQISAAGCWWSPGCAGTPCKFD